MPLRSDFTNCRNDDTSAPESVPTVTVALGGRYMRVHGRAPVVLLNNSKTRGRITGYTYASRRRLMHLLHQIDREATAYLPLFITLTYPSIYPATALETKRHLDSFCKRLLRRYKDVCIIWKLEYQHRGAPHYHLLVFGVPYLPRDEIAQAWYKVVGSDDTRHRQAGTRVERIASWNGVISYAAKYLGKVVQATGDISPGRFWGVYGRRNLPIRLLVRVISWQSFYWLRRRLWRRAKGLSIATGRRGHYAGIIQFIGATGAIALLNGAVKT